MAKAPGGDGWVTVVRDGWVNRGALAGRTRSVPGGPDSAAQAAAAASTASQQVQTRAPSISSMVAGCEQRAWRVRRVSFLVRGVLFVVVMKPVYGFRDWNQEGIDRVVSISAKWASVLTNPLHTGCTGIRSDVAVTMQVPVIT